MASITIETAHDYQHLRPWLATVPALFADGAGSLLYRGRNEVRLFEVQGLRLVVKRFKRHDLLKRLVYSFFRPNKARRAYCNAARLRELGFRTPCEIGIVEERCGGTLRQVYYISGHTEALPIRPRLIEQEPFDEALAEAYARFVASLHEAGVLHRDLNPTNVLFTEQDGGFRFELIDINRMRFFPGPVPKAACMENLTLFWWLSPIYRLILATYAAERGWTEADIDEAIRVKRRHDKRWVLRKRITHPFRKSR